MLCHEPIIKQYKNTETVESPQKNADLIVIIEKYKF